ncbi:MAG: hypothetical protein HY593_05390 [Candidatus Omnitrophica bacterium]|nr:hypothetical protein [Candidatus Omnitrophota bacterium]
MRQNFRRDKKRVEEAKKKKQEEKRIKRLNANRLKASSEALPETAS